MWNSTAILWNIQLTREGAFCTEYEQGRRTPCSIPGKLSGRECSMQSAKPWAVNGNQAGKEHPSQSPGNPNREGALRASPTKSQTGKECPTQCPQNSSKEGMLQAPQQCLWDPGQRQRGSPQFPSMKAVLASEVRETLRTTALGNY